MYLICLISKYYCLLPKVHLKDGYGKLIQQYCQLLITKLDFHRRNPGFPGNLVLSEEGLNRIGDNDVNNYFQMCVEMFDYIDEILGLQSASKYCLCSLYFLFGVYF